MANIKEIIHFYLSDYKGRMYSIVKPLDECTWTDHKGVTSNYYKGKAHIHYPIATEWWGIRRLPRCGEFEN